MSSSGLKRLLCLSVSVAALTGLAHPAAAQSSNTIEELVITAEKREQSLQDVPVAVSAFSAAKRDLIGINTIQDITNFTPGLQYNSSTDRVSLRGVGRLTNVLSADAAVANYSDGIYETFAVRAGSSTLYIDRVEVLRGPQGTLYGRNSIGGALNIISKRPSKEAGGEARFGVDNFGATSLEATYSLPVSDRVGIKLSGNWFNQSNGWIDNLVPGMPDEGNVRNEWTTELQVKIDFNDKLETWLKVIGTQWRNGAGGPGAASGAWTPAEWPTYYSPPGATQPNQGFACYNGPINTGVTNVVNLNPGGCKNPAVNSPWTIARQVPYKVTLPVALTIANEWIYHADNFDVKYLTGGVHYHYILSGTTDTNRAAPIASYTLPALGNRGPLVIKPSESFVYQEDNAFWSHEINLISTNDSPLQWVVGAYYFDQHYTQPVYTQNYNQPQWNGPFAFGFLCAQTGGVCPNHTEGPRRFDNRPDVHSRSYATFGQIDWDMTDQFKSTFGLRYSHDEKWGQESVRITCFAVPGCDFSAAYGLPPIIDLTQLGSVVSSGDVLKPGVVGKTTYDPATGFATRKQRQAWEAVTGTAGLEWKPDDDTMLYGKYSKGYKAGGFNIGIFTVLSYFPTTDKESVDSFEIGLKKNFGPTLQTNMAVFHYMYDNLQIPITRVSSGAVPAFGPGPTTATDFYNVPKSISQGFELETTWQPIDNLQILFNYSYNNTEIQGGTAVDSVDPTAIDAKAKPVLTFAQCAVITNGQSACPADVFTSDPTKAYTREQKLAGSSLPNAAKNKVAVNVNYTWEFEAGSLAGSLSYFWRDKQYGTVFERAYTEAPDWSQIDARVTWSSANSGYKIIVYGKNLTDDIGYDAGATGTREAGNIIAANGDVTRVIQGITRSYSVTPPRTYGIELQYKF
ncbi:MAG: TonB-dependent receptor [Phenylobacterium sp.]|uniref:TonB-dependent receptor n=1 Tax=Phenylobacterium sp. TaxID=1871053 RepID=UPI003016A83F